MTRYLVTDEQLRYAINSAISALDIEPMSIITSSIQRSKSPIKS